MLIKICGVTRAGDAALACELGADLIGLNFYPLSPRCVTPERARGIRRAVAGRARMVGVFVNAARDRIEALRREVGLDLLQFHGGEDDAAVLGWPVPVIRACPLRPGTTAAELAAIRADYLLLDSYDPSLFGGTGRALDPARLGGLDLRCVFIAGGLAAENVAEVAALKPAGVDVASGVESAPGVKDPLRLRRFIANARSA